MAVAATLAAAALRGKLSEVPAVCSVRAINALKFRLGLFENPYVDAE